MAIEYSIYYRGAPEDLRAAMDETLPPHCITHVSIRPKRPLDHHILTEEGFPSDFPTRADLRLDKFRRSEATGPAPTARPAGRRCIAVPVPE